MPLVVLAGQPASGKSTAAAQLRALLELHGPVEVLDEPSLHLERNAAYSCSAHEKMARATLKSAVERVLTKRSLVILDSLNNIKGYRYEVWCIARTLGTRYCVVRRSMACQRGTTPAHNGSAGPLTAHNAGAEESSGDLADTVFHAAAIRYRFDDLARRFEMPDSRNRWDAPLFTLRPAGDHAECAEVLDLVAATVTGAAEAPGNAAGAAAATGQLLQPTIATTNPGLLGTNVLHEIDSAAQTVVTAISNAQTQAGGGPAGLLDIGGGAGKLQLTRLVPLAELRRHKRAFLKLATKITFSRIADATTAQRMFVDYLRQQL
ncbi:putative Protein KTI12 like protein [Monoraphidium neglectum]|uniref:Protein KTI12 n=1 Tax=Monoraphidium neglectum TaxID=145388 RepID=A0A0D2M8P8_9CHLO|nr:putative Protein KTI12 like protein [Monoraphidium neglectum]KIY99639.1 putative Protein KTI12 like protein [Monoraphidium neglectum]|eukprot:XP_013898659.1 putative Protein KTI12 like protein [Monoraphidium neglectum]